MRGRNGRNIQIDEWLLGIPKLDNQHWVLYGCLNRLGFMEHSREHMMLLAGLKSTFAIGFLKMAAVYESGDFAGAKPGRL